jgi:hypothetical protein
MHRIDSVSWAVPVPGLRISTVRLRRGLYEFAIADQTGELGWLHNAGEGHQAFTSSRQGVTEDDLDAIAHGCLPDRGRGPVSLKDLYDALIMDYTLRRLIRDVRVQGHVLLRMWRAGARVPDWDTRRIGWSLGWHGALADQMAAQEQMTGEHREVDLYDGVGWLPVRVPEPDPERARRIHAAQPGTRVENLIVHGPQPTMSGHTTPRSPVVVLTGDGGPARTHHWCVRLLWGTAGCPIAGSTSCAPQDHPAAPTTEFEYWTTTGVVSRGELCRDCRKVRRIR